MIYVLLGYIHSGIQLAPQIPENELNLNIHLTFQTIHEKTSGDKESRNPFFGKLIAREIDIYDELENFSNLDISVYNQVKNKGFFGGGGNTFIGSNSINSKNIKKIKHLEEFIEDPICIDLKHKGNSQGKVLMSVCLLKTINKNNQSIIKKFKEEFILRKKYFRIRFSILGLRNLPRDISACSVKFSIKSYGIEEEFSGESIKEDSKNINIMHTKELNVELPQNILYWPFLDIKIYEKSESIPHFFHSLPLVLYLDDLSKGDKSQYKYMIGNIF